MTQASGAIPQPHTVRAPQRVEKIHALTSLRFLAALWVVIYHSSWTEVPSLRPGGLTGNLVSLGYVSVTFFFMLSGYILAMVYLSHGRPLKTKSYFVARFARIYPLYVLTLLLDAPNFVMLRMAKMGLAKSLAQFAGILTSNLVVLQAWDPHLRGLDFPNWSLSVEAVFYVIFPMVGILIWRMKARAVWPSLFVCWIGGQLLVYWVAPHVRDYALSYNPILHVPTFVLGILLARWQTTQRSKSGRSPRSLVSTNVALAIALAGLTAAVYWEPRLKYESVHHGLLAPVFLLLIWALSDNRSLVAKLLSVRWLVVLGEASFGLYLIHIPVLGFYKQMHWADVSLLYPTYLAVCIGLSVLSFYFVEMPSRTWILKRFNTRPKETLEASSDAQ
jgi:peptidoglycan/LPS O-acetylase OafA/YrhL